MKRSISIIGIIVLIMILFSLLTLAAYSVNGQATENGIGPSLEIIQPNGGEFAMQKTVIAGGGNAMQQGQFVAQASSGQSVAGSQSNGGVFKVYSGFWAPDDLAPTAAGVSVTGRVMTDSGAGLRNALVTITDQAGNTRNAVTSTFGYYTFEDVEVGQTYVMVVVSRRFRFAPKIVNVLDSLVDVDFRGQT